MNPFRKTYTDRELSLFEFMRKARIFGELTNKELSYFLPYLYLREYNQNEVVFFRDDPSNALYLLKSGSVNLTIDMQDTFEKLTDVKPGTAFGDNVLLRDTKRIYNATVSSESCEIYVIPKINIFEIFDGNPKIRSKMLDALASLYNEYTKRLFFAYKSASGFFDLAQAYDF